MLLPFFLLVFAIAWSFFIIGSLLSTTSASSPLSSLLIFVGVISPSLVAIFLTARKEGSEGVKSLIGKITFNHVNAKWYLFALTFMVTVKGLAAVIFFLRYNYWPHFGTTPWYLMLGAIAVSMWVQAGEEIGWRGYALPLLSKKFGLASSSIILGIIWAAWHIPFFYMQASDTFNQSFPLYLFQVTALSVAMTWLFWKVNGNLLPLMVLHAAINNTKGIVPSALPGGTNPITLNASPVGWITVIILWAFAFYFLYSMTRKSRSLAEQIAL
jgi:uncharacterized protein